MANDTLKVFGTTFTGVAGIKANDPNHLTKAYVRPEGELEITENGVSDVTNYASVDVNVPQLDTSDATATAGDILSGKTAYVNGSKVTGNIASKTAQTYTPGTTDQTIASGQYLSGAQTIKGDADLIPGNIKEGVEIFGVTGTLSGGGSQITVSPLSVTSNGTYTAPSGSAYSPVIVNVEDASAPPVSNVKFYDYDGTLLYSYTEDEFNELSALPANPTHEGLVSQGWNWTMTEIQNQLSLYYGDIIVGQMYDSSGEKSIINVEFASECFFGLYIRIPSNSWTATINWGDGETNNVANVTSYTYFSHHYSSGGNYAISITSTYGSRPAYYFSMSRATTGPTASTTESSTYSSAVKSVIIASNSVVADYAFANCYLLRTAIISKGPENVSTSLSSNCFYNCRSLRCLVIPTTFIGDGSNSNIFYGCSSLETISTSPAFKYNSASIFNECHSLRQFMPNLKEIGFSGVDVAVGNLWWYNYSKTVPKPKNIMQNVFFGGTKFKKETSIIISGITETAMSMFDYSDIDHVMIDSGLTNIRASTFRNCRSLQSITIPNSVTTIGPYAFSGCSSIFDITIPNSVTTIGQYAFSNCTGLQSVTIPDSVTTIGDYVFNACVSLQSVTIPNSVTTITENAFSACYSLQSITIPDSVTTIGQYAFSGCYSLQSITIPDSVTTIGNFVFQECRSLQSITIPNSVTTIGQYAFSNCTGLQSVTIPDSVTTINSRTFSSCSSIFDITIPDSVTTIDQYAFYNCFRLRKIVIGSGVTNINEYAFYYSSVSSLASSNRAIYFRSETPPVLASSAFNANFLRNITIYVPTGSLEAYTTATNYPSSSTYTYVEYDP